MVDANILIRAVVGKRVRKVIEAYAGRVSFLVPQVAAAGNGETLRPVAGVDVDVAFGQVAGPEAGGAFAFSPQRQADLAFGRSQPGL